MSILRWTAIAVAIETTAITVFAVPIAVGYRTRRRAAIPLSTRIPNRWR